MNDEELTTKILEFIETQAGDYCDEWYATPRDFASSILTSFAEHIGLELVVPEYIPRLKKPEVDRHALFKAMLPQLNELFGLKYKELTEANELEYRKMTGEDR